MNAITRAESVLISQNLTTTSLVIAEKFGKRHDHVLRAIQNIDICPEFTQPNFGFSEYTDSTGRKLPYYELTRDGFSLLVMGFTGKKAMEWKIKFLEAFNAMERQTLNPTMPKAISRATHWQDAIYEALDFADIAKEEITRLLGRGGRPEDYSRLFHKADVFLRTTSDKLKEAQANYQQSIQNVA